jgi:hypothetical protein
MPEVCVDTWERWSPLAWSWPPLPPRCQKGGNGLDFLHGLWFRITGRCFVCDRLMLLHTPWALYICERTPLPIEITEQGMACLEGHRAASVDPAA